MKRPSFQFYPADWRKDPALSSCSLAARGLWMELMCIAHEAECYGVLAIKGKPMAAAQLARMVGESPRVFEKLLAELEAAGVFSRNEEGAVFSRRMLKDEALRNVRAEAGRLGGNPLLLKRRDKTGAAPTPEATDGQTPTPSSSASSSSSAEPAAQEAVAGAEKTPARKTATLPEWLDAQAWADFVEHRKRLKKPLTPRAVELALQELGTLKTAGHDPMQVINRSILNGWQGLFAPDEKSSAAVRHQGFEQRNYSAGVGADGRF